MDARVALQTTARASQVHLAIGQFEAYTDAILRVSKVDTKALGSNSTDLVYRPWAPCRYIDTRNVGGKIAGGRSYETFNDGATYGGAAACDPKTLAAVSDHNQIAAYALNVTIVDTSAAASPGWMTIRPYGSTNLTALVNWTVSSAGFQLGNSAVVTADQGPLAGEIEIFTSGSVHAIVDVAGAFAAPGVTALDCTEVQAAGSGTIANNTEAFGPERPACASGYTAVATSCTYTGSVPSGLALTQVGPPRPMAGNWTACRWRNATGGSLPGSNFIRSRPAAAFRDCDRLTASRHHGRLRAPSSFTADESRNARFRTHVQRPNWTYQGIDLNEGPNVDVVLTSPYKFPMADGHYDVLISGQAFEHVKFFWLTWMEMVRTLKPGGFIFLIAPSRGPEHRFPVDCWRFYPDGYRARGASGPKPSRLSARTCLRLLRRRRPVAIPCSCAYPISAGCGGAEAGAKCVSTRGTGHLRERATNMRSPCRIRLRGAYPCRSLSWTGPPRG